MEQAFTKKLMISKFSDINILPIYPDTSISVKMLIRKNCNDITPFGGLIKKDPSFSAYLLQKVKVTEGYLNTQSIDNAIQRIGLFQLKTMITEMPVLKDLTRAEKISCEHAYSSFLLMANLLSENEIPVGPDLPLVMLFHDLGNLVLREYTPRMYQMAAEHAVAQNVASHVTQTNLIHIHHGEIGGIILSRWGLPDSITKPIMYHHMGCEERKDLPEDFLLETALVQFADYVDNLSRGLMTRKPSDLLLDTAGISEIDYNYWIGRQSKLIIELRDGREEEQKKEPDRKITDTATVVMSRSEIPKPNLQKNQALDVFRKNLIQ